MVNGVLVERTVQEVVPALEINSEGLRKVLDDLLKQYKTMQDDMEKWKVCSGAHVRPEGSWLMILGYAEEEQCSGCSAMNATRHHT